MADIKQQHFPGGRALFHFFDQPVQGDTGFGPLVPLEQLQGDDVLVAGGAVHVPAIVNDDLRALVHAAEHSLDHVPKLVAVARYQDIRRAVPQYFVVSLNPEDGSQISQAELPSEPLPGGLLIDRKGRVIVNLLNGNLACFGQ
jgi:hypothetical protein